MSRLVPRLCAPLLFLSLSTAAFASDHRDAPYTDKHPMADIGDIYLFPTPSGQGMTMVFTVNPLSGSGLSGTQNSSQIKLDPNLTYQFKFDTNDDNVADIAYKIKATDLAGERQKQGIELRLATGADAISNEWTGDTIGTGNSTALNQPLEVVEGKSGERLFVGPRRDPFFFDFRTMEAPAALAITQALAGGDRLPAKKFSQGAFGSTDMTVVVLDVPSLGTAKLGYWVVVGDKDGIAVDRMGRTATQGIFLVPNPSGWNPEYYIPLDSQKYRDMGALNDAYNSTPPSKDRENYGDQFAYRFKQLEVSEGQIEATVEFILPDILHWDPDKPAKYPNGRNLREDAVFWTIAYVNPFYVKDPNTDLPKVSVQRLSDEFPYVAPSVFQEYKPGSLLDPVHPIYVEE